MASANLPTATTPTCPFKGRRPTLIPDRIEVKGFSPVASPSSLEVTLEGSVFARSQVYQTIELYDYVAGVWEQVDARAATRFTDSTVTLAATGDLSRFVEGGTMFIERPDSLPVACRPATVFIQHRSVHLDHRSITNLIHPWLKKNGW